MLWEDHKALAIALRDQGLADGLAARFALRPLDLNLLGQPVTFAHLVVSKSQQAVEKLTKGYLLWQSPSFDPTKGHAPFTELIEDPSNRNLRGLKRLVQALNYKNRSLIKQLKWLEDLAPRPPTVAEDRRGHLQALEILRENTEYPFWSASAGALVTPARGISLSNHAVPAFKALRSYLTVLAESDPPEYREGIGQFLEDHPMNTETSEWPRGAD